jgi:subtilisin family serine protease
MRKFLTIIFLLAFAGVVRAQQADFSKMSSMVRQLTLTQRSKMRKMPGVDRRSLCAFVRVSESGASGNEADASEMLKSLGCKPLAQLGDIFIADIPLHRLASLSLHPSITRIEARQGNSISMDTTTVLMGGARAHLGDGLPQAFRGEGVVVGVMDVGFDLTHPNFFDTSLSEYRIRRMWDFLSVDTIGSPLYVGADYISEEALKAYAHSRDGLITSHGTHTLGSAAGSGYDSPYRGMAPASDICLVANAVSDNAVLVDSADVYKFTYATDALGFKYLFDYADSVGKPCVVSFSEGSPMDFRGDDELYYEVLSRLTGPGHIMVASAGNEGLQYNHVKKPADKEHTTVSILSGGAAAYFSVKGAADDYILRLNLPGPDGNVEKRDLTVAGICALPDSVLTDSLAVDGKPYYISANCYPSCFDKSENVIEVILETDERLGLDYSTSVELIGSGCEVELFRGIGYLMPAERMFADNGYSVHSPGSAPSVISVGATGYRTEYVNYLGEKHVYNMGKKGHRGEYSSVGPTFDGRIKPDVMAPGTNIISSYSSYYLEAKPDASDIDSDVQHFEYGGRTYAWNANSGTSMSTPVVAGAIALWLQANPTLTPEDVMEVIRATSRQTDPAYDYPNILNGYGEIDAYAGLLYVLGFSKVEGISNRQPAGVHVQVDREGLLRLTFDREVSQSVTVRVYSTAGALVTTYKTTPAGRELVLPAGAWPHGVYAVQVNGPDSATTGSTLIRL